MEWRRVVVRLLVAVAGAMGVVLVIFVGIPWFLEFLEPTPEVQVTEEEIVRQAVDSLVEEIVDRTLEEEKDPQAEAADEETTSPLIATWENGDTVPVVFPRAEGQTEEAAPPPVASAPSAEGAGPPGSLIPGQMDAVIPVADPAQQGPVKPDEPEETPPPVGTLVAAAQEEGSVQGPQKPEAPAARAHVDAVRVAPGPPLGAVREVQELLDQLGYEPGRVDGVWGPRTARAWRAFMKDTGGAAGSLAPGPSLGTRDPAATGPAQAGEMEAGPPAPNGSGVVPGTLRSVMGYRLPLVSRQDVPDQVVSGVLIPAHTTFVILRPGYWELTGLTPEEVRLLEEGAARAKVPIRPLPVSPPALAPESDWTLLRMLGLERPAAKGK